MTGNEGRPPLFVPDAIEPIVGWKAWKFTGVFPYASICSPLEGSVWKKREELTARCLYCNQSIFPKHLVPHDSCTCGIYIAKEPCIAAGYSSYVLGRCYGWGRVVVHYYGWRVEHAYPKEFYVNNRLYKFALLKYKVPIHLLSKSEWEELLEAKSEIGREDPTW